MSFIFKTEAILEMSIIITMSLWHLADAKFLIRELNRLMNPIFTLVLDKIKVCKKNAKI